MMPDGGSLPASSTREYVDVGIPPGPIPDASALRKTWQRGDYEPHIHYIRFPYFKNLASDLRVDFSFPITALVGANGSNKSSILRALQGCPEGQNIGLYWFGTQLDSVPDEERHRFIHGRWSDSCQGVVEIIQIRRARTKGRNGKGAPDYFESDEPLQRDGMQPMPAAPTPMPEDRSETRWRAIRKNVVYFDFRAEISAFDKYFHHNDSNTRGPIMQQAQQVRDRKEALYDKSSIVRKMLDKGLGSFKPGGKELVISKPVDLGSVELQWVSYVLGRMYSRIRVIGHRAFKVSGTTALLETGHLSYSEAWAGSGEFAVVRLVGTVLGCVDGTLLLLDEPEVSLHPGAQARLMSFLHRVALDKKLQIVLSTHSPAIIDRLPDEAIKVFDRNAEGKIMLRSQRSSPAEAFVALEHKFHKKTIIVEDRLAREVVRCILRSGGASKLDSVDVKFLPGGASVMLSRLVPVWALEGRCDVLLLLDGDKRIEMPQPSSALSADQLEAEIKRVLGVKSASKYIPANTGGVAESDMRRVIDWCRRFVRFLPGEQPDKWVGGIIDPSASIPGDGKGWWDEAYRAASGMLSTEYVESDQRFRFQQMRLGTVSIDETPDLVHLKATVDAFVSESA
ncbi:ATP-dependent nuclease [Mycolicibacterium lutetiense]